MPSQTCLRSASGEGAQMDSGNLVFQERFGQVKQSPNKNFACTDDSAVNFENADINVGNSSNVIIGPTTRFNVNGNITIYPRNHQEPINDVNTHEPCSHRSELSNTDNCFKQPTRKKYVKFRRRAKLTLVITFGVLLILSAIIAASIRSSSSKENEATTRHKIIDRDKWNGQPPRSIANISAPVPVIIIKHTNRKFCVTFENCAGETQDIQTEHMIKGAPDIWYNFLIGGDGNVYVGRGWSVKNQWTNKTMDIAYHGNFDYDYFYTTMINATMLLIKEGLRLNRIVEDYIILCHNHTFEINSPGRNVYKEVITWDHYDNGTYFGNIL